MSGEIRYSFNGDAAKKYIDKTYTDRLKIAAILVTNKAKELISDPSPPRSSPDEPPHKETGRLRASIAYEVDEQKKVARVGTNVKYGKFLELGTVKMAARPFLRTALLMTKEQITKILRGKQ